eukprot:TRINITY_DN159_c0_g1_i7.p1 TRINITY_DN159_c0_g1~~TRINITY_DN159_c0_g1_i7.p1  ORF type:complete len:556 (+),score=136.46 TRINITY_DN159_c0_g1_i7:38-1705(+)
MTSLPLFLTLVFFLFVATVISKCPPGVNTVNCFVDPCQTPAPQGCTFAKCVSNFCGGCNRKFFDESGNEVCTAPKPTIVRPKPTSNSKCPPGVRTVNCFVDPCQTPAPEGCTFAKCVPNFCGGCNRKFFDESGNEVCTAPKPTIVRPKPTSNSKCPPGVRTVNCFVDPCQTPAPEGCSFAKCVPNFCGGCNRKFFDESGNEVCTAPKPTIVPTSDSKCPPGVRTVNCFIDPCQTPAPQGCSFAKCVPNFCGGCNRKFFDESGNEVCTATTGSPKPKTLPEGTRCTTSGTRGFPPVPCESGLFCRITDPGRPEIDVPNRGVCTAVAQPTTPQAPECGPVCMMFCPFGNELDANGCPICKCKEAPATARMSSPLVVTQTTTPQAPECGPVCMMFCPFGNELDANGCPICKCKQAPRPTTPQAPALPTTPEAPECGPVCMMFCPFGNELDANGCPICKCKQAPGTTPSALVPTTPSPSRKPSNCGPTCRMFCPLGFETDKTGCPICKCKSSVQLSPKRPTPSGKKCGPVCMIFCKYGNVLDENGCPTCRCRTGLDAAE